MTPRWRTVLRLELRALLGAPGAAAALALTLAAGLYAVHFGRAELSEHRRVIALLPDIEADDTRYVGKEYPEGTEAGATAFYHMNPTVHAPSPWAALSVGQRDVHPFHLRLNLLPLYGQLFDSGLENPEKSLAGHFDLAFVFVALIPLLAVALCYDAVSADDEGGAGLLLRAQPVPAGRVAALRLLLRLALTAGLCAALLAAGLIANAIEPDRTAALWLAAAVLHAAFWVGLSAWVASWRRSSSFNAVALASAWLVLAVVAPAALNSGLTAAFPVPHGHEIALVQRREAHAGWDRPKDETMAAFAARNPELAAASVAGEGFSWRWYYAIQEGGDAAVEGLADAHLEALRARQAWSRRLAWLSPPAGLQLALNALAGTDLDAQVAYLESVRAYHRELKRHFYPLIFSDRSVTAAEHAAIPDHRFASAPSAAAALPGLAGLAAAALAAGLGALRLGPALSREDA